ncbi:MAG: HlyD family efflux transporter periplasmic adaptor subunit [Salinisphaera sp.]|jgi:membrane fusion protein (multidrug efflux system)|nr:HlyD family efflux transporter periplasmic adaptor subunit [Salinisphaera sp.]
MAESSADNNPQQTDRGRSKPRRKWYLLGLALVFVVIGVVYAIYYFTVAQFYASTDDSYVGGNRILLTPQINGTVTQIAADNTDLVHAGETVITLNDTDALIGLAHAKAALAETVRSVNQLFAQANKQKAIIEQQQSAYAQSKRDYERNAKLVRAHGVTQRAFEQSRATYRQDRAALQAARDRLTELQAQTAGTTLQEHPRVKQAEAELRLAYLNLQRTRIPAPVTGYVAQREVQLGQRVDPSKPMLSIVPSSQVWIDANFKETQLAAMRIGQPATVTSDFYGSDVVFHGHVAGISAGTGSAFELLPPQNATGNWIKIVRRVPVRIALNADDVHKHPLRIGLSTETTVNLHDSSGPVLAQKSQPTPRYRTKVYHRRLHGADQLIKHIVDANDGNAKTHAAAPADLLDLSTPSSGS